jgi:hypothetical protein
MESSGLVRSLWTPCRVGAIEIGGPTPFMERIIEAPGLIELFKVAQ